MKLAKLRSRETKKAVGLAFQVPETKLTLPMMGWIGRPGAGIAFYKNKDEYVKLTLGRDANRVAEITYVQ